MPGRPWQITNTSSAGGAATASEAAPISAGVSESQLRLRSLQVSVAGTSAGTAEAVIRDGGSGSGTIIWAANFAMVANGGGHVEADNIDIRASVGNALTIEFTSGVTSATESVNAQGDIVPKGYQEDEN